MYFDKRFDTFNLNKVFYPLMKKSHSISQGRKWLPESVCVGGK